MAKAKRERSTRLTGKFSSVETMVRATSGDRESAESFERNNNKRRRIHFLIALRGAMGLSQTELAKRLGCTQSRISKLEGSDDDDISLGDFRKYSAALGFSMQTSFMPKGARTVDRVKFHAFQIKNLVDKLAGLVECDPAIASGVSSFFSEAAFNFLLILQQAADKLPRPVDEPDEDNEMLCVPDQPGVPSSPPQLVPKRRARRPKAAVV